MNDKEFLERIKIAYRVYPNQSQEIKTFISWLYKQYGIIEPKDKAEPK
jgi:hypothetical protein